MRHIYITLSLLCCCLSVHAFGPKTFVAMRSQAVNAVREIVSWQQYTHQQHNDRDASYTSGTVAATLEYSHSFNNDKFIDLLFGLPTLTFSGSRFSMRQDTDILADYFGLPADFKSTVCFSPFVSNVAVDLNGYFDLNSCISGLYCKLHVPIVHTKWDLNMAETVFASGQAFHPAGYLGSARIERANLPDNVVQAFHGASMNAEFGNKETTFGDMREPMRFGTIFGRQSKSRVAEVQFTIGWDYVCDDHYHIGAFARVGAPTGNKPNAQFLFEPIVGNRYHWTFGGGISSHARVWCCKEQQAHIALYCDAYVEHLFSSTQKRSFDLTSGPGSRYMLISELCTGSFTIGGVASEFQYNGRLLPAINKTTLDTKIDIAVQADIVFKVAYQCDRFEWDIGYNFWANSKEKISWRQKLENNRFALKGDAQIYGFTIVGETSTMLSTTQNNATIQKGQGDGNATFTNDNADNETDTALNNLTTLDFLDLGFSGPATVKTSVPALFLSDDGINEDSGLLPKAISHKIFMHVGQSWDSECGIDLFCGIGASVEWACMCIKDNSAHSQWALWVRTGLVF